MNEINLAKLCDPFPAEDVEWRIQKSGVGKNTQKPYALVLAYIDNRAIQERLDSVCGPENWCNQFVPSNGGTMCGIGIRINGDWVWKWDGAENSNFEPFKGGLSGAMKRAAVQWGIGRYLYNLEAGFANFDENGKYKDKIGETWYKWNPPALPAWAVPKTKEQEAASRIKKFDPTEKRPDPLAKALGTLGATVQGKVAAGEGVATQEALPYDHE